MERYSKLVRKFFKAQVNINKEFQHKVSPNLSESDIEALIADNLCHHISSMVVLNSNIVDTALKKHILYTSFLAVQLFSDFYRNAVYYKKCISSEILVNIVNDLLNSLTDINDMEGIAKILTDSRAGRLAYLASLEFDDLSIYKKVIRIKSLSINDVNFLKSLNPFFEEEYVAYNISVDADFIKRQISKWQMIFKDNIDKSYNDAVDFLVEYRLVDKENTDKLVMSIVDECENIDEYFEDKDRLKNALEKFYKKSDDKKLIK